MKILQAAVLLLLALRLNNYYREDPNMKDCTVFLAVSANGEMSEHVFSVSADEELFSAYVENDGEHLKVTIHPKRPVTIHSARMETEWKCSAKDRILLNGYQSWTDTRELTINDRMYGLLRTPGFAVKKFGFDRYGDYHIVDYSGKKGELHGFSYGYVRSGEKLDFIGSLNERTGYTILKYSAGKQLLCIEKDCAGLSVSEPYELFDIVNLRGSDDEVFDRYFELMNIDKPRSKPLRGYTSWYNHYQNINAEIISRDLEGMHSLPVKPEIFQIDDGYQTAVGDWLSIDSKKFPDGLKPIVDAIHADGMMAGLWLAPLVCETNSDIFKNHPDWLLKDSSGNNVFCGCNWGGFYALDIENSEVRDYLKNVFDTVLNDFGFDFVKLDFLYAASVVSTAEKTRGQSMCEAMDFIRELVGDKLILGCGVPLWPAFGKVDYCRIGCDVGLDWNDVPYMRIVHRERISTRNTICDTVYRRQLDGRAFLNDPDVFLLRYKNLKLSLRRKKQLATVNGLFGSVLFMSDNAGIYDKKQKALYSQTVSMQDAEITSVSDTGKHILIKYRLNGSAKKLSIRL